MNDTKPQLKGLSQRAYARHRGIETPSVHRWYHKGRLILFDDGSIDAVASDAAIAASRDPFQNGGPGGGGGKLQTAAAVVVVPNKFGPRAPPDVAKNNQAATSLTRSREMEAEYSAKLKQLEYEQKAAKLCEVARVDRAASDVMGAVRNAAQRLADRLSSRLAAESDPRKVHALLTSEVDAVLTEIADVVGSLPGQVTATQQ